jgi:hypothetical protein
MGLLGLYQMNKNNITFDDGCNEDDEHVIKGARLNSQDSLVIQHSEFGPFNFLGQPNFVHHPAY